MTHVLCDAAETKEIEMCVFRNKTMQISLKKQAGETANQSSEGHNSESRWKREREIRYLEISQEKNIAWRTYVGKLEDH